eukprot:6521061-Prorocentrum_lima.AAC.1
MLGSGSELLQQFPIMVDQVAHLLQHVFSAQDFPVRRGQNQVPLFSGNIGSEVDAGYGGKRRGES